MGVLKLARDSIGEPVYFRTRMSREDVIRWKHMTGRERTEENHQCSKLTEAE